MWAVIPVCSLAEVRVAVMGVFPLTLSLFFNTGLPLHRLLTAQEAYTILSDFENFPISTERVLTPPSGSLLLFNRITVPNFKQDGISWKRKTSGVVNERYWGIKVSNTVVIRTGRVRGLNDKQFVRRSYWKAEENVKHIILVHYLREDPNDVEVGPGDDQLPVIPAVILDPDSNTDVEGSGSSDENEEAAVNFFEDLTAKLLEVAETAKVDVFSGKVEELDGVQLLYSNPPHDWEEALTIINARKEEASVKRKHEDESLEDLATLEEKERGKELEGLATFEEQIAKEPEEEEQIAKEPEEEEQIAKEPEDLAKLEERGRQTASEPEVLARLEERQSASEPEGLATLEEKERASEPEGLAMLEEKERDSEPEGLPTLEERSSQRA